MEHRYVYDHYYGYDELAGILKEYAQKYPEFCRLETVAVTPQGRDILLLSVTDRSTGEFEDKPALYVEGNIHCGEVTGCMTVMYMLDTIFSNLSDEKIAGLLKRTTLYALPRVSPDGTEYYLNEPGTLRSAPRFYPYDELQPGLHRKDMDGDGVIRLMRIQTPYGAWKPSQKDPRLMVRRQPDDVEGTFYNVYDEGSIEGDWDGLEIQVAPAPFGNDFNRNYPIAWQPDHVQAGAGKYPLSNPETKANADFVLSHPNICCVMDLHTAGGQFLYPPGFKSAKNAEKEDMDLYQAMGKMARQETGYVVLNIHDQYMPVSHPDTFGAFDDYVHFGAGVPGITIELWNLGEHAGITNTYPPREDKTDEEKEDEAVKALHWIDENVDPALFKPWTAFEHPQLGAVEIGGCDAKFVTQNPPPAFLETEIAKNAAFLLRLPDLLPRLTVDTLTTKPLSQDTYLVEAVCGNLGYMSTYVLKDALKFKTLKGVTLEIRGVEVLQGDKKAEIGHLQGHSGYRAAMMRLVGMNTFQRGEMRKKVSWVVRGKPGDAFEIAVTSGKAGSFTVKGTLQ